MNKWINVRKQKHFLVQEELRKLEDYNSRTDAEIVLKAWGMYYPTIEVEGDLIAFAN